MAENFEFKTETKKLLDMMINSIYTHKEIFLRELISNASDAIDKRHYLSLTDSKLGEASYEIIVEANKERRELTISDNGIGFTKEELIDHLGTIAKSGSKEFLEKIKKDKEKSDVDIIGQFGVGFYSAFMVAKNVVVLTKSPLSDKGYKFESTGLDSYQIEEEKLDFTGTKIILSLRESNEDFNYDEFLDEYQIKELIRKYSDYVRYPIKTWVTKYKDSDQKDKDGNPIQEEEKVLEKVNSQIPLWKKNKSDIKDEDLNEWEDEYNEDESTDIWNGEEEFE
jgi:molecular chaperone HtpG